MGLDGLVITDAIYTVKVILRLHCRIRARQGTVSARLFGAVLACVYTAISQKWSEAFSRLKIVMCGHVYRTRRALGRNYTGVSLLLS